MQVVALIHEGNGEFAATFPDFPGMIAVADGIEALLAEAARLVAAELDAMIEDGVERPPLRTLTELAHDPAFAQDSVGAMVALVPCAALTDMVPVALDRSLLAAIDRAAGCETRSAYIAEAVRRRLAASDAHRPEEPASAAVRPEASLPASARASDEVIVIMESIRRSLAAIDRTPAAEPAKRQDG